MEAGCSQACGLLAVDSFTQSDGDQLALFGLDGLDLQACVAAPVDLVHLVVTVPRLDVVGRDDAGHALQPVGEQITRTDGLAEDELAVAEAAAAGTQVDLQDLDVPVPVMHVLHRHDAVEAQGLDDVADVLDDLVVGTDDLRVVTDLLADHPLEQLAVDAERVDAQLAARQDLHDEEALHALLFFELSDFALERFGGHLARQRVSQQVGVRGDFPEATAVDSTRRLDTDSLAVGQAFVDFLHGPGCTDGLDAFGPEHAVPQPVGERDLVVDHLEGLVLADGVYRSAGDAGQVVRAQRERPDDVDLVLVDELVERGVALGSRQVREGRQVDDVQTELLSHQLCAAGHDEVDAGAHRREGECAHAVGEAEQNTLLHDLPLRDCRRVCGYGSCRRLI